MRTVLAVVLAAGVGSASLSAVQEGDTKHPPLKRGDEIVVEGCLNGTLLEASDVGSVHDGSLLSSGVNFQLKGKKDILKKLTSRHDRQLVEITGVLKSNLDTGATRGTKIGRTRIVIGVRSRTADRSIMPPSEELLPVLEVKAYESASINCRR